MRYINKNQITQLLIEKMDKIERYEIIFVFIGGATTLVKNKTKEECVALAKQLGLTLID